MASYRIYFVDPRGRVRVGEAFVAGVEADAHARLERAERHDEEAAELWRGGRLVRRLSRRDDVS